MNHHVHMRMHMKMNLHIHIHSHSHSQASAKASATHLRELLQYSSDCNCRKGASGRVTSGGGASITVPALGRSICDRPLTGSRTALTREEVALCDIAAGTEQEAAAFSLPLSSVGYNASRRER